MIFQPSDFMRHSYCGLWWGRGTWTCQHASKLTHTSEGENWLIQNWLWLFWGEGNNSARSEYSTCNTPDHISSHRAFKLKLDMYRDRTAHVLDQTPNNSVLKMFTRVVDPFCMISTTRTTCFMWCTKVCMCRHVQKSIFIGNLIQWPTLNTSALL